MKFKQWVALGIVTLLVVSGCAPATDWKAQYAEYIGEEIVEIDSEILNEKFLDETERGTLTRTSWARLNDNRILFLGIPAYGLDVQTTVERTVTLNQKEFTQACAQAFGDQTVESWRFPHSHRGNSLRVYLNGRNQDYCEFFYLPSGWELRTIRSQGIVKPAYH